MYESVCVCKELTKLDTRRHITHKTSQFHGLGCADRTTVSLGLLIFAGMNTLGECIHDCRARGLWAGLERTALTYL